MPLDDVLFLHMHAALELLEPRGHPVDKRYDFSVDDERAPGATGEFFQRGNYLRKLLCFVLAVAGYQLDVIGCGVGEDPNAVVLGLEGATLTGYFRADTGVHRLQ